MLPEIGRQKGPLRSNSYAHVLKELVELKKRTLALGVKNGTARRKVQESKSERRGTSVNRPSNSRHFGLKMIGVEKRPKNVTREDKMDEKKEKKEAVSKQRSATVSNGYRRNEGKSSEKMWDEKKKCNEGKTKTCEVNTKGSIWGE